MLLSIVFQDRRGASGRSGPFEGFLLKPSRFSLAGAGVVRPLALELLTVHSAASASLPEKPPLKLASTGYTVTVLMALMRSYLTRCVFRDVAR